MPTQIPYCAQLSRNLKICQKPIHKGVGILVLPTTYKLCHVVEYVSTYNGPNTS